MPNKEKEFEKSDQQKKDEALKEWIKSQEKERDKSLLDIQGKTGKFA